MLNWEREGGRRGGREAGRQGETGERERERAGGGEGWLGAPRARLGGVLRLRVLAHRRRYEGLPLPYTLHPKHETQNPENPKPETRNPGLGTRFDQFGEGGMGGHTKQIPEEVSLKQRTRAPVRLNSGIRTPIHSSKIRDANTDFPKGDRAPRGPPRRWNSYSNPGLTSSAEGGGAKRKP